MERGRPPKRPHQLLAAVPGRRRARRRPEAPPHRQELQAAASILPRRQTQVRRRPARGLAQRLEVVLRAVVVCVFLLFFILVLSSVPIVAGVSSSWRENRQVNCRGGGFVLHSRRKRRTSSREGAVLDGVHGGGIGTGTLGEVGEIVDLRLRSVGGADLEAALLFFVLEILEQVAALPFCVLELLVLDGDLFCEVARPRRGGLFGQPQSLPDGLRIFDSLVGRRVVIDVDHWHFGLQTGHLSREGVGRGVCSGVRELQTRHLCRKRVCSSGRRHELRLVKVRRKPSIVLAVAAGDGRQVPVGIAMDVGSRSVSHEHRRVCGSE
mmetsp:Transcript_27505/g.84379  ORF Transcript_27505/g.84379 Transcript_27505/m.84379 type:complete len:323 (-) Transcript_27505:296-1264(-)